MGPLRTSTKLFTRGFSNLILGQSCNTTRAEVRSRIFLGPETLKRRL